MKPAEIQNPAELMLAGEAEALIEQIGFAPDASSLNLMAGSLRLPHVDSLPALRSFLSEYQKQLLTAVEMPAILQAWQHTQRFEVRELIAFDQVLAQRWPLPDFAAASQRVGRMRLRAMRPLKELRLVQRYRDAVTAQQAHGWHMLVYGITLAVYGLPLRQGLMNYSRGTLGGFIAAAGRGLQLTEEAQDRLLAETEGDLRHAIDGLLPAGPVVQ